jgi:hypothetical protein
MKLIRKAYSSWLIFLPSFVRVAKYGVSNWEGFRESQGSDVLEPTHVGEQTLPSSAPLDGASTAM